MSLEIAYDLMGSNAPGALELALVEIMKAPPDNQRRALRTEYNKIKWERKHERSR